MTVELTETQYKKLVDAYHNGEWEHIQTLNMYSQYCYRDIILDVYTDGVSYWITVSIECVDVLLPKRKTTEGLYEETIGRDIKEADIIQNENTRNLIKDILGD